MSGRGRFWAGGFPRPGDPVRHGETLVDVRECLGFTWPLTAEQPHFNVVLITGEAVPVYATNTEHEWRSERRKES